MAYPCSNLVMKEIGEDEKIYARTTAATAAAPAMTNEAALAEAAPVYLAIGPEPVAEAPLTGVASAPVAPADQAAQVDEAAAASGVLVWVTTPLLYE